MRACARCNSEKMFGSHRIRADHLFNRPKFFLCYSCFEEWRKIYDKTRTKAQKKFGPNLSGHQQAEIFHEHFMEYIHKGKEVVIFT